VERREGKARRREELHYTALRKALTVWVKTGVIKVWSFYI